MTWWPIAQSIYLVLGAGAATALTPGMTIDLRSHDAGFNPAAAFALVFGIIILWPVLVALAVAVARR